ncbi:hypothetical protein ASG86_15740 [Arthrobacter sp. Soil764]|nr:hypothetical protein ASG86_15740 [Arthrobacter sp. Soil764]
MGQVSRCAQDGAEELDRAFPAEGAQDCCFVRTQTPIPERQGFWDLCGQAFGEQAVDFVVCRAAVAETVPMHVAVLPAALAGAEGCRVFGPAGIAKRYGAGPSRHMPVPSAVRTSFTAAAAWLAEWLAVGVPGSDGPCPIAADAPFLRLGALVAA